MNRSQKGTSREHKIRRALESLGFACIRASGSHGLVDLIGVRQESPTHVHIQVRTRDWPGLQERRLIAMRCPPIRLAVKWVNRKKKVFGSRSEIHVMVIGASGALECPCTDTEVKLELAIRGAKERQKKTDLVELNQP